MNSAHLEAILRGSEYSKHFTLPDGTRLRTNGHLACIGTVAYENKESEYEPLGTLWLKSLEVKPNPTTPGSIFKDGKHFLRKFPLNLIQEAYFRCFDCPTVTWTETGEKEPVYVHEGGKLVGIVMPMNFVSGEPVESASDADVFDLFACALNDYYLVDYKEVRKTIDGLEEQLSEAEESAEQANAKVQRIESRLDGARRKLRALKTANAKPGAEPNTPDGQ